MRKVVAYTTATLHKLHLLLVHTEDTTIRVCWILVADNEAVRERGNLKVIADTCHWAALWNDIAEVVEKLENLGVVKAVWIVSLDARQLRSDTVVHILWRSLVDVAERVLEGILAHPHLGSKIVTCKIDLTCGYGIVVLNRWKLGIFGFVSHSFSFILYFIYYSLYISNLSEYTTYFHINGIIQAYKIRDFTRIKKISEGLFFRHFIHKLQS